MKLASTKDLQALRRSDIKAFESLFKRSYGPLCDWAFQILGDEMLAEEAVQEMFYRLWLNRRKMNPVLSPDAYLRRAVRNNALMLLRTQGRVRELNEDMGESREPESHGPEEELKGKELEERYAAALDKLPERTRTIYRMSREEGMSYRDISRELSLSIKTVEAHISRTLKLLRETLEQEKI